MRWERSIYVSPWYAEGTRKLGQFCGALFSSSTVLTFDSAGQIPMLDGETLKEALEKHCKPERYDGDFDYLAISVVWKELREDNEEPDVFSRVGDNIITTPNKLYGFLHGVLYFYELPHVEDLTELPIPLAVLGY